MTLRVVADPGHIGETEEAIIAADDGVFTTIVVLIQDVELQIFSALTQYVVVIVGTTINDVPEKA
jgi:hypothetical protein